MAADCSTLATLEIRAPAPQSWRDAGSGSVGRVNEPENRAGARLLDIPSIGGENPQRSLTPTVMENPMVRSKRNVATRVDPPFGWLRAAIPLLLATMIACAFACSPGQEAPPPEAPPQRAAKDPEAPPPPPGGSVDVTYIGNEGYLIADGGTKVLVDALFREGVPGYESIPPDRRDRLETAAPPFDGVDLVLVTHFHPDHFDAEAVGRHMLSNPGARLVTTVQTIDQMRATFARFGEIESRVQGITPPEGVKEEVPGIREATGIGLRVLNLHHGRDRPIENLGFLFDIGGMRILHVGDTEALAGEYARYDLQAESIDVVFLPFYQVVFDLWRAEVPRAIGADRIVVMHVPEEGVQEDYIDNLGGREKMLADIGAEHPESLFFRKPMQAVTIPSIR